MEERQEHVYLAALAGLLHDIGKFAQRAGWQKGEHAEVGGEFVRQYVPKQWRTGLYPVMAHHDKPLPDSRTRVVALADRLSAGERTDEKTAQPKQLLSIFCSLEIEGQQAPAPQYLPLKALELNRDSLFPGAEWSDTQVTQAYEELWQGFSREADILGQAYKEGERASLETYIESLLLLLQRYAWCIPSAYYRSAPDVSLYDHSRMTGALAAILADQPEPNVTHLLEALDQWYKSAGALPAALVETDVAIIVGGDLSGVQDFIYTITSRGATSALRGRSFYLQLLTEATVRFVLRRLDLPMTNLIYQGGGSFYLLARPTDAQRLREVQQEISSTLLTHHRGALYLALASEPLKAADFYQGRISGKWERLSRQLRQAKQHRFAELEEKELAELFLPQGQGGTDAQECQVCGQEHPHIQVEKSADDEAGEIRKCPQCRSYEALGKDLREANYLWIEECEVKGNPPTAEPGEWSAVLEALGMRCGLTPRADRIPRNGTALCTLLSLKDEALDALRPDARTAVGRRFLVNVTPLVTQEEIENHRDEVEKDQKEGDIKPFSLLEAQSTGIHRLGVLRMDVDNLGQIFSEGFGGNATLSRVASLSFATALYFEGWVEDIAERMNTRTDETPGDTLYSIYSGGDDLFFVGAWDRVVELARAIRADLTPFAANHPGIHASGGIVLVGGKYPLAQAAQDAKGAEDAAKGGAKNALSFLGQVMSWKQFGAGEEQTDWLGTVSGLKQRLVDMTTAEKDGGEGAPQALLRRLIQMQEMYEEAAERRYRLGKDLNRAGKSQTFWGPWMWRGYYTLKRMVGKKKGEPWDSIDSLAEGLKGDNFRAIEWIGLAARWAELTLRK